MRKRYFIITLIVIIIAGLLVWACKHPLGEGVSGVGNSSDVSGETGGGDISSGENNTSEEKIDPAVVGIGLVGSGEGKTLNGITLPANSLSAEEQSKNYDPSNNYAVLFENGKIPALTVTTKGVILAAAEDSSGKVVVRRSSDMGRTWYNANDSGYGHPFFINCHNGDVLLGAVGSDNKTIIYRSSDDGKNWTQKESIDKPTDAKNSFVTYGQGITLRHQNDNSQKLIFPMYYTNASNNKPYTAIMFSENDGGNFNSVCNGFEILSKKLQGNLGDFSTFETKLIELPDGSILYNTAYYDKGYSLWAKSTDCGKNWTFGVVGQDKEDPGAKHIDFSRYEFNGKPIKSGGDKYALRAYSHFSGNGYSIGLTTNDFNNGDKNKTGESKYSFTKELVSATAKANGYPAITVLPDGTIATLTEENNGVIFRRFNLYWLTTGAESINY